MVEEKQKDLPEKLQQIIRRLETGEALSSADRSMLVDTLTQLPILMYHAAGSELAREVSEAELAAFGVLNIKVIVLKAFHQMMLTLLDFSDGLTDGDSFRNRINAIHSQAEQSLDEALQSSGPPDREDRIEKEYRQSLRELEDVRGRTLQVISDSRRDVH